MELKLFYNFDNKLLFLVVETTKGVQYYEIGYLRAILSDLRAENKIKDSDYLILKSPEKWTLNRVKELTRLILKDFIKYPKKLTKDNIRLLLSGNNTLKWRE